MDSKDATSVVTERISHDDAALQRNCFMYTKTDSKDATSVVTERISHDDIQQLKRKRAAAALHLADKDAQDGRSLEECKRPKVEFLDLKIDGSVVCQAPPAELYGWPSKLTVQTTSSFQKSGLPARFMFYDKGDWKDISKNAIVSVVDCFKARQSSTVLMVEEKRYLLDFVYMLQLNLQTGYLRSIAWIDVEGKCFFPSKCIEGYHSHLFKPASPYQHGATIANWFTGIDSCQSGKVRVCSDVTSKPTAVSSVEESSEVTSDLRVGGEALTCTASPKVRVSHDFALLHDKIVKLEDASEDFKVVENRFLTGLGMLASYASITGIFKDCHKSTVGQGRYEAFRKQEEVTRKARGDANVRYAWHGTSKHGISGIVLHGFGQPRVPENGAMYGVGVYLAPEDYSHVSAVYSDIDENGEQHMVLCRVILGSMEQVAQGSEQFHPSSEDYDTGVDDISSPKRYIIWSTHMNTHILPEYVVSFKLESSWQDIITALRRRQFSNKTPVFRRDLPSVSRKSTGEYTSGVVGHTVPETLGLGGLSRRCPNRAPRSPWMCFPMLFRFLQNKLPEEKMSTLKHLYVKFKAGTMARDMLIKNVRLIAGDSLLADIIRSMQAQEKAFHNVAKPDHCSTSEESGSNVSSTTLQNKAEELQDV